jgi:galactoside O-acetyltransferase
MGFLSRAELDNMGFKYLGENVLISDKCSIYNAKNISINDNTRIDDFCILSASKEITIGKYNHISCHTILIGADTIILEDFVTISSHCSIYSSSDDYSGNFLTNPTVDNKYTNVKNAPVIIKKHVIIGCNSVVLPGVTICYGSAIGSLSFVNKNVEELVVMAGTPLKYIKKRINNFLELENKLLYDE